MGNDVGQIFPTANLNRDHSILFALVCEKEISHMGKTNGNPDLVCEKLKQSHKLSLPRQDDCKTREETKKCITKQRKQQDYHKQCEVHKTETLQQQTHRLGTECSLRHRGWGLKCKLLAPNALYSSFIFCAYIL